MHPQNPDQILTTYTLKCVHALQDDIPPPYIVLPLFTQKYCLVTKGSHDPSFANEIICEDISRRFSPFILITNPKYLYLMSSDQFIEGFVPGSSHTYKNHLKIQGNVLTPVLDLSKDIIIHGIGGKTHSVYKLFMKEKYKISYHDLHETLLSIVIVASQWIALATCLLPILVKAYIGIIFDSVPLLGDPLLYLSQTICSEGKDSAKAACKTPLMLPSIKSLNDSNEQFLQSHVNTAFFWLLLIYIYVTLRKYSLNPQQPRYKRRFFDLIPISMIISTLAFPWVSMSIVTILKTLLQEEKTPRLDINFVNALKSKNNTKGRDDIIYYLKPYSNMAIMIIGLYNAIQLVKCSFFSFYNTIKRIKNEESMWIWERNTLNTDFYGVKSIVSSMESGEKCDSCEGFWVDRKNHLLSTQFVPTILSRSVSCIKRKHALVCGVIKEIDLFVIHEELELDQFEIDNHLQYQLSETPSSIDSYIPDTIDVYPEGNRELTVARAHLDNWSPKNTTVNDAKPPKNMPYSGIVGETPVFVQLNHVNNFNGNFSRRIVGCVESRVLTYFLTYGLVNRVYKQDRSMISSSQKPMHLIVQAKVKQLLNMENMSYRCIEKGVRLPVFDDIVIIFKCFDGICLGMSFLTAPSILKWLKLVRIFSHTLMLLQIIVSSPYKRRSDNLFAVSCLLLGILFLADDFSARRSYFFGIFDVAKSFHIFIDVYTLCIITYAIVFTVLFLADNIACYFVPQIDIETSTNVQIFVTDKDSYMNELIYGYCKIAVKMCRATINHNGQVTLEEICEKHAIPTLSVYLHHIASSSHYVPFLTITNRHGKMDVHVVGKSELSIAYLREYFNIKFKAKRVVNSLSRKIVNYVRENNLKNYQCFCVEIV